MRANTESHDAGGVVAKQLRCPVCSAEQPSVFWEAAGVPVFCNVLCATREEAVGMPRGDIRLAFCCGCGLIHNAAFEPDRLHYDVAYENALDFSPRFREYADTLAARLVERYSLRNKVILEIACGQGDFLRTLCELGGNRGIGFDPSHRPAASNGDIRDRITFVRDYYGERYADHAANLICCRHALEHLADPLAFLQSVRRAIGGRTETVVFFEVPNALFTLRELGIWDLIYEHCTYFVAASLARVFAEAGFTVLEVAEAYEGQFLTIEARPADDGGGGAGSPAGDMDPQLGRDVEAFETNYREKVSRWRRRLEEMRLAGQRAVLWGSGSKGVTFLNILRPAEPIEYVVDINPRKQGMFVAGTGQRVAAPAFLRAYRPDTIVVMNPVYLGEIRQTVEELGLSGALVTA